MEGFKPSVHISPLSGSISPIISLISVVFPAPSAPISPVILPFSILRLKSLIAVEESKVFIKFLISTVCIWLALKKVNFYCCGHALSEVFVNVVNINTNSVNKACS